MKGFSSLSSWWVWAGMLSSAAGTKPLFFTARGCFVGAPSGQYPDSGREAFKVEDPVMEDFLVKLLAPQAGTCSEWTLHPVGLLIHSF